MIRTIISCNHQVLIAPLSQEQYQTNHTKTNYNNTAWDYSQCTILVVRKELYCDIYLGWKIMINLQQLLRLMWTPLI